MTMSSPPSRLGAAEAAALIRERRLSSVELVQSCLDEIEAREAAIGAWETIEPERALAQARERDAASASGPLHGVPIAIKDIIDTADLPTRYGSPIYPDHRPAADAACVRRLRAAGAVILGKTVTTEFAHVTPGKTRNPHDLSRTPGGSSSGSAAAVAAFMAPTALGTQTGGSVVRPAAFCGLFGFKPSWGRTELDGVRELARSFDTVGWMARRAADLDLLARVLLIGYAVPPDTAVPRIALCRTPFDGRAEPAALAAVERCAEALREAGASVTEIRLPSAFGALEATHRAIASVEAARAAAWDRQNRRELLTPAFRDFTDAGAASPPERYEAAQREAAACREELASLHRFDALLAPAAPGEAPPLDSGTGDAVFSLFWSLLRVPCVTIPFAKGPHGLPLGVQILGAFGRDETLIRLGVWIEERLAPISAGRRTSP
jgi:Asp-tRNA(Asn)/Glu-tRNA(Gln) amidotransferase A subunit family amidase